MNFGARAVTAPFFSPTASQTRRHFKGRLAASCPPLRRSSSPNAAPLLPCADRHVVTQPPLERHFAAATL